jgi:hypothetical protein
VSSKSDQPVGARRPIATMGAGAPSSPVVFLNHLYVVLDSATYRAIEEDAFLQTQFAPTERRTTVRTDETYTGRYFYGTNTYFEVFDVATSPRPTVGDCGIAFGVEETGDLTTLRQRLGPEVETDPEPITRLYQGTQIPWFFMATLTHLPYESRTSVWLMEYHAEFLTRWNPQPDGQNRGILRKDILKRYAEVVEPVHDPYLEDVVGVTIAADEETTAHFVTFGERVGYEARPDAGGVIGLHGPRFVLRLVPLTSETSGVREIRVRARRPMRDPATMRLGRSRLTFADGHAIWTFAS